MFTISVSVILNIRFDGGPGWKFGSAPWPDERLLPDEELVDDPLTPLARVDKTTGTEGDCPPGSVGVRGASGICMLRSQAWTTLSAASTALLELSTVLLATSREAEG